MCDATGPQTGLQQGRIGSTCGYARARQGGSSEREHASSNEARAAQLARVWGVKGPVKQVVPPMYITGAQSR